MENYHALLLKSGKYSNLTIRCGDRDYKLHRAIIYEKSAALAAAFDGVVAVTKRIGEIELCLRKGHESQTNLLDDESTGIARPVHCTRLDMTTVTIRLVSMISMLSVSYRVKLFQPVGKL